MKRLIALSFIVLVAGGGVAAAPTSASDKNLRYNDSNAWIKKWTSLDQSIYPAIREAAKTFGTSEPLMRKIVGDEGGNVHPAKLRKSLCQSWGIGWNTSGNPPSAAFGPFQFMLDYRGACMRASAWGTFGSYDDAAFTAAKRRGNPVPYRFKHPASNVGQAITASFMLANGGLSHWCASQC